MLNIKSLKNKSIIGFLIIIFFTAYCIPINADIIPLRGLEEAEVILYGKVSDRAILQRINDLEMALFGQHTKGSIVARAEQIIEYVYSNDSGISLTLLVNIMEWTLYNEVRTGNLLARIEGLEMSVLGDIGKDALITRVEKLSSLLLPLEHMTTSNVIVPQGKEIHIKILEEINTAEIEEGQEITFGIDNNIKEDGHLIIPAGTRGTLIVSNIKRAGNFGRDASLSIRINDINAFDGSLIPLNLKLDDGDNNSKDIAIGVSLLSTIIVSNPVGLVAGYFFKGKDIVIPVGTVIQTQVMEDLEIYSIRIE